MLGVLPFLNMSNVVIILWLDVVKIKQGNENKRSQSCGKAAVVQNETAVHTHRSGGYGCVEHAGDHAVAKTVFAGNGAQPRREGKSVNICLCGKRPRYIEPRCESYTQNDCQ